MDEFWIGFLVGALTFAPLKIVFGTFVVLRNGKWVLKWERFDD